VTSQKTSNRPVSFPGTACSPFTSRSWKGRFTPQNAQFQDRADEGILAMHGALRKSARIPTVVSPAAKPLPARFRADSGAEKVELLTKAYLSKVATSRHGVLRVWPTESCTVHRGKYQKHCLKSAFLSPGRSARVFPLWRLVTRLLGSGPIIAAT
jgi:hypothetical protein